MPGLRFLQATRITGNASVMSQMGQERTFSKVCPMSALLREADMAERRQIVEEEERPF